MSSEIKNISEELKQMENSEFQSEPEIIYNNTCTYCNREFESSDDEELYDNYYSSRTSVCNTLSNFILGVYGWTDEVIMGVRVGLFNDYTDSDEEEYDEEDEEEDEEDDEDDEDDEENEENEDNEENKDSLNKSDTIKDENNDTTTYSWFSYLGY